MGRRFSWVRLIQWFPTTSIMNLISCSKFTAQKKSISLIKKTVQFSLKRRLKRVVLVLGKLNYKHEYQEKASVFCLTPGTGVHHPIMAPHWVKNGDDINIMLSLGFRMRSFDIRSRIYKTNHYLRKTRAETDSTWQIKMER